MTELFQRDYGPSKDMPNELTCTTCEFSEDFSNYWTAVLFFRARNSTFHRIQQEGYAGYEDTNGGMTVYYMNAGLADYQQLSKVTASRT